MDKLISKAQYDKTMVFIKAMKEKIVKYLGDVKSDLSKMPPELYVESVCNGNIANGNVYECNELSNKNYFDEKNREQEIVISDYDTKCMKETYQRLLKEKSPLVLVAIPENDEWVKFAVKCPCAGTDICKLKTFRWHKGDKKTEEKDWKRDYDL